MPNVPVQTNRTFPPTGQVLQLAFSSDVTAGNLLIVAWRRDDVASITLVNVNDTLNTGSTWNIVYDTLDGSGSLGGWAWFVTPNSGACTVNINFSAFGITGGAICIVEYSGANTLRASSAATVTTINGTITSPAINTQAGDLVLGFVETNTAANYVVGSGYNIRVQQTVNPNAFEAIEDNLSSSGGSTVVTILANAGNGKTIGIGAFFFMSAAGGNDGMDILGDSRHYMTRSRTQP